MPPQGRFRQPGKDACDQSQAVCRPCFRCRPRQRVMLVSCERVIKEKLCLNGQSRTPCFCSRHAAQWVSASLRLFRMLAHSSRPTTLVSDSETHSRWPLSRKQSFSLVTLQLRMCQDPLSVFSSAGLPLDSIEPVHSTILAYRKFCLAHGTGEFFRGVPFPHLLPLDQGDEHRLDFFQPLLNAHVPPRQNAGAGQAPVRLHSFLTALAACLQSRRPEPPSSLRRLSCPPPSSRWH